MVRRSNVIVAFEKLSWKEGQQRGRGFRHSYTSQLNDASHVLRNVNIRQKAYDKDYQSTT